jgi:carboxymethylenebutenolidase
MDADTRTIDIPVPGGTADAILAEPSDGAPHPGVLMFMDAFGLRPRLEDMASRLAAHGYVVLVPNLFYRHGRAPVVDLGDLRDPGARGPLFERLRPMMQVLTPALAESDIAAYLAYLGDVEGVCEGPVGAVGYCMGGALALRAAAVAPDRVAAVASFHGGRLATDEADSPHLLADRIRAEVYVAHADKDASMPPEAQRRLAEALSRAGVPHRTEMYDGCLHGFTMADTAAYDEAATERHWQRLLGILGRALTCGP